MISSIAPQQREAVATMKKIQDEAYKYALKTMKNYTQTAREVNVNVNLISSVDLFIYKCLSLIEFYP